MRFLFPFHRTVTRRGANILIVLLFVSAPVFGAAERLAYPQAPRDPKPELFWGVPVPDPYRWLDHLDSVATRAWVATEATLSRSYLDAIPQRPAIKRAYLRLVNYARASVPERAGNRWFVFRNSGLQNQDVLYVRDSEHGPERVLIDPNRLSHDGTVALGPEHSFSKDGKYLAYATTRAGEDWEIWHVRNVDTGEDLPDRLRWSKFSTAAWIGDTGFYYERFNRPSEKNATLSDVGRQAICFHALHTPQASDRLVFRDPARDEYTSVQTSEDEKYVFLYRQDFNGDDVAWRRRNEADAQLKPLFPKRLGATFDVLGDDGDRLYFLTNDSALRGRIVSVDVDRVKHSLRTIVPEGSDAIEDASLLGNVFYVQYLHDAHSVVRRVSLSGKPLGKLRLPGALGSGGLPVGRRRDRIAVFSFQSYTRPQTVYRYDVRTGISAVVDTPHIAFSPDSYVTDLDFAFSKDGTRVPVYVTHRRRLSPNRQNPTLVYAYGGFDVPLTPQFDPAAALWLELGGAYAVVDARGGGEYGKAWYDAGKLRNKQHTIDDVVAGTQMLVDRGISVPSKLALNGESNGGFVVGAVMTQRPGLIAAAIPEVGVMDLLRYQRWTGGKKWVSEYGSADESKADFTYLRRLSPDENVRRGTRYPATLVMVSDHDDRVYPAHSFKFVAELQYAQAGPDPILLRIEHNAGHGWGRPLGKIVEEVADRYAFLAKSLNFQPTLPSSVAAMRAQSSSP